MKKSKKIEKCSYCGKESTGLIKVGPDLRYCDYENCYARSCMKHEWFKNIIPRMYPNILEGTNNESK